METKTKLFSALLVILLPLAGFSQLKPTSYDSDGDGIPDSVDKCVLVPGTAQFHGCPFEPNITASDRDGDGIPDAYDACADMFGLKSNNGCPNVALINGTTTVTTIPADNITDNSSMYTSTSSSEAQELSDFKDNLLAVLASSGKMFADIKTSKDARENDYKTALCLAYADECFIDMNQHFYATYGTYTDLNSAMGKYDELKRNLQTALPSTQWGSTEMTDNGIKTFDMRKADNKGTVSPHVTASVEQTKDNDYKVFLTVDSK